MRNGSPRPLVGVVGHEYVVQRPFGALPVTGTPTSYVDGLVAVGAHPVLLPGAGALPLLDLLDGLVLTGGGDVDPELSGADPSSTCNVNRARDDAEVALARAAAGRGVPLLGVCRGLQVLAVAFGGMLGAATKHVHPSDGHHVSTRNGSTMRDLVGPRTRTPPCMHRRSATLGSLVPDRLGRRRCRRGGRVVRRRLAGTGGPVAPRAVVGRPALDSTGPAWFGWLREAADVRAGDHAVGARPGSLGLGELSDARLSPMSIEGGLLVAGPRERLVRRSSR